MTDDFSDHPQTLGEVRSDKSRKAQDWSVKEMLISILRRIDSGELAPRMGSVVLGDGDDRDKQITRIFYAGTRSIWEQDGLHARAMMPDE